MCKDSVHHGPRLIKWANLGDDQQDEARRTFVHWRYDTTSATFEQWADKHAFYIRKDGHIANKPNHCEPSFLADGED